MCFTNFKALRGTNSKATDKTLGKELIKIDFDKIASLMALIGYLTLQEPPYGRCLGKIGPHFHNSPEKHLPELLIQRRKPEVCSNGTSVNFRQHGLRGRPANGFIDWVQADQ